MLKMSEKGGFCQLAGNILGIQKCHAISDVFSSINVSFLRISFLTGKFKLKFRLSRVI